MLTCPHCSRVYTVSEPRWRCACGGYLVLKNTGRFSPEAGGRRLTGLWRYLDVLGIEDPENIVSLGEGWTPMIPQRLEAQPVLLKLDYLFPTGSFKDRGSSVMVSKLKEWGVKEVVEDSSGNAGASVAAYCASAGIRSSIYVPAGTSAGKATQIRMYGADLVKIPGTREETSRAAVQAGAHTFYAGHNWSPYFVSGMKTLAYEIAEQLNWQVPDWVVTPVGGGSLILGLHTGFKEMFETGIINRVPRFAGVQSSSCAPVYQAWQANLVEVPAVEDAETAAEGIAVSRPVKGKDILEAIRASDGVMRIVDDAAVWNMTRVLARIGIYVEPTAAAAPAALAGLRQDKVLEAADRVVVILTGTGLKATDKMLRHYFPTER